MSAWPEQVAKLIPMLSSEHDGEVVAAARAIGRSLKSSGADFHDLADIIGGAKARVEVRRATEAYAATERATQSNELAEQVAELSKKLLLIELPLAQAAFVRSMLKRSADPGWGPSPSDMILFKMILQQHEMMA